MSDRLPRRAWLPNAVTMANIAVGFGSMIAAAAGSPEAAVYLLMLAILLDSSDGRLARALGATSRFGLELDSLCDIVSFGVAPAFLVWEAIFRPFGAAGVVVAGLYLLAAAFRLARFNLESNEHAKSRRTTGVPTPIGAGYLMATVLMRDEIPVAAAAAVVLLMAAGMVSRWHLPDLAGKGLVSAMLVLGLFNYLAVVVWPNWYTVGWWNVWNVLILVAAVAEDRRAAPAGEDSPDPA